MLKNLILKNFGIFNLLSSTKLPYPILKSNNLFMKKLPKSLRKYIRKEKARIRREFLDLKEAENKIKQLYEKFFLKFKNQKNN